jgi:hypothetical protein
MSRILISLLLLATSSFAISIQVFPSLAPNFFGAPSYAGWEANALAAIQSGAVSSFDPTSQPAPLDPTTYTGQISQMFPWQNVATNFNAWYGVAAPNSLGALLTSELGNRLTFGVRITGDAAQFGNGGQFALRGLAFALSSTDGANTFGFAGDWDTDPFCASPGACDYGDALYGIRRNTDGTIASIINSGSRDQLVDELIYIGIGNALEALSSDPGATNQERIFGQAALVAAPYQITAVYTLGGMSGQASVNVVVPEPSSWILALPAVLVLLRRRRAAR